MSTDRYEGVNPDVAEFLKGRECPITKEQRDRACRILDAVVEIPEFKATYHLVMFKLLSDQSLMDILKVANAD